MAALEASPGSTLNRELLGKLLLGTLTALCLLRLAEPEPPTSGRITPRGTRITRFERPAPAPAVFVVHSIFQDHFTCLPMARALWRSGFEVVIVEFQAGRGFGEYVVELEELAKASGRPQVFGVGHSMGADIVFSAQGFDGRAGLGFPVEASLVKGTVLVAAGAWDQVHTRASLLEAAGDSTLVISPYSDHSQESLDPYLQNAVVKAFGGSPAASPPNKVLAQGGLVLFGTTLLVWLLPVGPSRPRAISLNLLVVALLIANLLHPDPVLYTAGLTFWLGSAWAQSGATSPGTVRLILINILIVSSAAGVSWALHGYQNIQAEPSCLAGLPLAILSWFPILSARLANSFCQPQATWPYLLTALVLMEVVFPGRLVSLVRLFAGKFYQRVTTFKPRLEVGGGKPQTFALLVLLAIGALMWTKTLAAGYSLTQDDLVRLVWKLFSLLFLPLMLWVFIARRLALSSPYSFTNR